MSEPRPVADAPSAAGVHPQKARPAAKPEPHAVVLTALAEAVLAVPGVVRLEPTLSTAGPSVLLHRTPTDGIRLLARAQTAEVDVNIATVATCQARSVTHEVQARTAQVLTTHGYPVSTVTISVLTIEASLSA